MIGGPRFDMSIREIFSDPIDLAVINQYAKRPLMLILTVLWHVYYVAYRRVLQNRTF